MRKVILAALTLGMAASASAEPLTFYLSPTGKDSASGLSAADPMRSFKQVFSAMEAGDELVLLDGVYGEAAQTGYISYAGLGSAQPPSGRPQQPTVVRAQHPGNVKIIGGLFLGRSFRTDSDIVIQGLTFEGLTDGTGASAATLYNASRVTIKDCGFHSDQPTAAAIVRLGGEPGAADSDNRLENVWIWGRAPAAISAASGQGLSARRVLVRLESGGLVLFNKSASLALENALSLEGDGARWIAPPSALDAWPNEERIRKDLCADPEASRGFCAWTSLTSYLRDLRIMPASARDRRSS